MKRLSARVPNHRNFGSFASFAPMLAGLALCGALAAGPLAAAAAEPAAAPPEGAAPAKSEAPAEPAKPTAQKGATPAPAQGSAPAAGQPTIGLDRLLTPRFELPDTPKKSPEQDCNAWAARFDESRGEIETLEQQVAATRAKIGAKSQGAYQYSPMGGTETTSDPEVTKLRAQLKRDRESVEAAQKRLRELLVEADLAGVPRSCTEPHS